MFSIPTFYNGITPELRVKGPIVTTSCEEKYKQPEKCTEEVTLRINTENG